MRKISLLLAFILTAVYAMGQDNNTPITALADSMKAQEKPVLILFSTDWCRFCKIQKVQLEKNRKFQAAKNNFYFVEFSAETKHSILFNGKVYSPKSSGLLPGTHELVIELGGQKGGISYPFWVILDKDYTVLLRRNGFLTEDELTEIMEALSQEKQQGTHFNPNTVN